MQTSEREVGQKTDLGNTEGNESPIDDILQD